MKLPKTLLLPTILLTLAPYVAHAQFKSPVFYNVGTEPQQVLAADVNNDGNVDLVICDFTSLDISVLLGNGNGTFQKPMQFSTKKSPQAIAVGDFNGDGTLDLAVVEYDISGPGLLQIFLGDGNGGFGLNSEYPVGALPYDITVADFNGDGKLDIATANNGSNQIGVMFGNGDGTFEVASIYPAPLPERVLALDLNGDGFPDLAVLDYCGNTPRDCQSGR